MIKHSRIVHKNTAYSCWIFCSTLIIVLLLKYIRVIVNWLIDSFYYCIFFREFVYTKTISGRVWPHRNYLVSTLLWKFLYSLSKRLWTQIASYANISYISKNYALEKEINPNRVKWTTTLAARASCLLALFSGSYIAQHVRFGEFQRTFSGGEQNAIHLCKSLLTLSRKKF